MNEKKRISFIKWSIFFLIALLISSFIFNIKSDLKDISSIQPELNALKECVTSQVEIDKKSMSLINSIEKNVKYINGKTIIDSSIFNTDIRNLTQNLKGTNDKTINDLILKIETKLIKYEGKTTKTDQKDWWEIIFSWPFIVIYLIIALIYFNFNLGNIQGVFGRVKSLNILGNEIEFGEEVKINTELSIKNYRLKIKEIFSYQIQKEQLNDKLRYLVEDIKEYLASTKGISKSEIVLRCTIHIQDILFQETLYQLLDYYPNTSNGGSGRIKSIRFGIIGLSWRTEKSKIKGNINSSQNDLIKDWGLDITETTSDSNIKSYAAILLKSGVGTRLGIVYLDSKVENLFGDFNVDQYNVEAENFEKFVCEKCKEKSIVKSLTDIQENVADKFLQIRIYE